MGSIYARKSVVDFFKGQVFVDLQNAVQNFLGSAGASASKAALATAALFLPHKCLAQPPAGAASVSSFEPIKPSCANGVKVTFLGDIYLTAQRLSGPDDLFVNVKPLLKWADFNVGNFEGVVSNVTKRAWPDFPFALKMAPTAAKIIAANGIKHVTRANNHSMDFGEEGLVDTHKALDAVGIQYTGVGKNLTEALKPLTLAKNGINIAVFSLTTTYPQGAWATDKSAGVAFPWVKPMRDAIGTAKKTHDFVVVEFHWGQESSPALRPHQPEYARLVFEHGADLVVGHHAHVAQAIEVVDGKTIAHGLGNFLFTSLSETAAFGMAAHSEFCKSEPTPDGKPVKNAIRTVFTPLHTNNFVTQFKTTPLTLPGFLKFAKYYADSRYFPLDTSFYIPTEQKTQTLAEWLQF